MDFNESRGGHKRSSSVTNFIHNEWIETSIPSVDRRNEREWVIISQAKYANHYHPLGIDLHQDVIAATTKRNIPVYKSMRMITTLTYSGMKARIQKIHGIKVTVGMLCKCKPFFCQNPTEKSLCLCKVCLNTRQLFDAVRSFCKAESNNEVGESLSKYLLHDCTCEKESIGYYQPQCCHGKCPTGTNRSLPLTPTNTDPARKWTYYQYEQIEELRSIHCKTGG